MPEAIPIRPPDASVPLCVDLDGTLVKSDLLLESFVATLKRAPFAALAAPAWLARGRAVLKRELALRADLDVATLPYDTELVDRLRREQATGREIWLATAADESLANGVAAHLGVFAGVMASDGRRNLKAGAKAEALVARFGERGFDYVGSDGADVPVWARARERIEVPHPRATVSGTLRAMRAHHWAKNLLLFVPLLTSHRLLTPGLAAASLAFVAFCLVASAVYLLNDLGDLGDDRRHPHKRRRALAAGEFPISTALMAIPLLLVAAAAICTLLPWAFGALLAAYFAANLAYTGYLKRIAIVDVLVLAGLYAVRIFAGAAVIGVPVSQWLLAFSLFAFLSIALVKRYVEVSNVAAREEGEVAGRGYSAQDGLLLAILGIASATLAVLVLALYVTSPQVTVLYRRPDVLWAVVPLFFYWLARAWLLAWRGQLHEDPLLFAVRDRASYAVAILVILAMLGAT